MSDVAAKSRTPVARCQCVPCGRRFAGDGAFDAHRLLVNGRYPRRCVDPAEVGLVAELGECRLGPSVEIGVEIWHDPQARSRARVVFGRELRPSPSAGPH